MNNFSKNKTNQTIRFTKKEINEARGIIGRIKRGDLKGNSGQAIKNSTWQIATTLTAKIGSLLFTIVIARLMLPEIYGLYGLALSTILFMGLFSDFGIGAGMGTFLAKNIDKKPRKAKGYFYLLMKYKIILIILTILILFFSASWVATSYYNKPIYYALLAGIIYLPITLLLSNISILFTSKNDFRPQFIEQVIFQITRMIIIPLSIIYFLERISSTEIYLFWIFILLSFCYLAGGIYLLVTVKIKHPFKKVKEQKLNREEKKDLMKFILPLSVTALSGVFFGFIDQIMLGHYVKSQFLGFYQVAFNLIASASAIISFSSASMFPIFARLNGRSLEKGFKKTINITMLISIATAIFTFVFASTIINLIYGNAYSISVNYLRLFSILIISFPLIALYTSYYTSQKKTKIISILLIISTIVNILLNYFFINLGLQFSMFYAVMGAGIATVISRLGYLGGLMFFRKI